MNTPAARALLYAEAERDSLYYEDIADALDGFAQIEQKQGNARSGLDYMTQAVDAARKFGNKTTYEKNLSISDRNLWAMPVATLSIGGKC